MLTILLSLQTFSQSNFKKFLKLSCPLKTWVIFHPFKAKRALQISNEAKKVADSIAKTNLLDGDISGGRVDAFRHAFWMASLQQKLGKRAALSLGKAYEKDNYKTYKKKKLEEGVLPDKISSEMDLYNNNQGIKLSAKGNIVSKNNLIFTVVKAIRAGKMKIIKKDEKGNFLTCTGQLITKDSLKGKWENNKCLVLSNF
ncbi:DUF6973 domain-containing protein [Polaribacter sargassicola]|uniref:DUF6973 domain-containing protein n=1 Tax=Polaribacter sargassicola TaxID=2836891 RepID=UPI001F19EB62|nr:hypothetical protein [Polaribacter sp. DS7-9]